MLHGAIQLALNVRMQQHDVGRAGTAVLPRRFAEQRQRGAYGRAVPVRAEYARAGDVDVTAARLVFIPRLHVRSVVPPNRLQEPDVAPLRETAQPREARR